MGLERKKDGRGGLIVRNGNFDWSPTCHLSTTKIAQFQRTAIFTAAFCSTWRADKVGELHSTVTNGLQGRQLLLWNPDYILGQNMFSFRTMLFLVHT